MFYRNKSSLKYKKIKIKLFNELNDGYITKTLKTNNFIYIIIISLSVSFNIYLLLKLIRNNNNNYKEELLNMCYKSRNVVFTKIKGIDKPNLITIQDKLKYLSIHESPDIKSKIVDKILLHEYSIKKLGKDICVPIIKTYDDANEIKLEDLPQKFVLKCNHGSGMNILCIDKTNFDIEKAKKQLNIWKKSDYSLAFYEFQYINIERKIFAEQLLKDNIEDYKIYCFHGKLNFIRVQKHIEGSNDIVNNYYDIDWNLTEMKQVDIDIIEDLIFFLKSLKT